MRPQTTILNRRTIQDRESLARQFLKNKPFKHVVIDDFFVPDFCAKLAKEFPEYDERRFLNEHGHRGKAHHENISTLGPSFRRLNSLVRSSDFLELIGDITGIRDLIHDPTYFGGGTHENLDDMELDPHVDFNLHPQSGLYRRVNLLLYLNQEWENAWGGALELHTDPWLPPEKNQIKLVRPAFNRCVLFETSDRSWHGFQTIRLPRAKKNLSRRSVALYLYTREAPPNIPVIPWDLTVFVDRPLPSYFTAGRALTLEDERLLQRLIIRRDWKLKHLYDAAIGLFNRLRLTETQRDLAQQLLARKHSPAGATDS